MIGERLLDEPIFAVDVGVGTFAVLGEPYLVGGSLNGLNTLNPGRRKSFSLPVTTVRL